MVDLSPEIQIKAALKPGSVYYFPEASFSSSDSHYFVVLNHNPLSDSFLVRVLQPILDHVKSLFSPSPPFHFDQYDQTDVDALRQPLQLIADEIERLTKEGSAL